MTPKEKADKLCIDFLMKPNTADIRFGMDKQLAKQCALIAVEEILSDYKNYLMHENTEYKGLKYWQEVKKEIENL
jgi:hypothetical protein